MKSEQQLLCDVMKHFEGMNKIEVYDLIHKMEVISFYAKSPLCKKDIWHIVRTNVNTTSNVDPFQFTILPNGNFCEFIGSNDWLHVYKEQKKGIRKWDVFDTYYFKTKYAPLELIKLTKKNIIENVQNTPNESKVIDFLKNNSISKKDIVTGDMALLTVID